MVFSNVTPVGKVSSTWTVVNAPGFAAGLVSVRLSVVLPPTGIEAAPKDLVSVGGVYTFVEALAVLPVPPLVEVTVTLLFFSPAVVPVTFTENVHAPLAARVAPARLTVPEPAVAVIVPPPQVPLNPFGVATTSPAGSVSVKATPVKAVNVSRFVIANVREVDPFSGMVAAPKVLVMLGCATTASGAEAAVPVRATGPPAVGALVVLVTPPAVELVTFMTT